MQAVPVLPPTINPIDDDLIIGDARIGKLLNVSPMSVWRYRVKGKRGVRLPAIPWGKQHATTTEAIRWWFAQLQHIDTDPPPTKHRRAIAADVEAECESLGI